MRLYLWILLLVLGLVPAMEAVASDARLGIEINESVYVQDNFLDRGVLQLPGEANFERDVSFNLITLYPTLSISFSESIEAHVQGDFYLERHFDDVEDDTTEAELTGAYLSFDHRRLTLDIGLQPVLFGKGRIIADDAPAVDLTLKAGDVTYGLKAARLLDLSPAVGLTLGYTPGYLEQLSIFGLWFQDRDDAFAQSMPLFRQLLLEPESEADLYWIGATADLFIGHVFFSLVGAYQFGEFEVFNANNRSRFDVSAYYGDISLETNLSSKWSAGIFGVLASGDAAPLGEKLTAFVTIQPYNPRALIFFDSDFLDINEEERLTFGASVSGGVIAPGLNISYAPTDDWRIDAVVASFYAHESLDSGERWYGWEFDLGIEYTFGRHYTLFGQAARFWHGDYFDILLNQTNDPASRLVVGLNASF